MISDGDTNTIYFSELLKTDPRFSETTKQIVSTLDKCGAIYNFLPDTKDIWARDYMPIQINDYTFIEYRFDPDYLQDARKGYRDLKTYPDIVCDTLQLKTKKFDVILDGGNIVKSTDCVILTDKIVRENRISYNRSALIQKLQDTFEVEKIILIPWDKSEEYGHSDGMIRFIDKETVVIQYYLKDYAQLLTPIKQAGLKIEYIDYNVKKKDSRDWAYLNFLQTKDLILIPKFGIEHDDQAFEQIKGLYSTYAGKIHQIDMNETVRFGGALNCISWTTKE